MKLQINAGQHLIQDQRDNLKGLSGLVVENKDFLLWEVDVDPFITFKRWIDGQHVAHLKPILDAGEGVKFEGFLPIIDGTVANTNSSLEDVSDFETSFTVLTKEPVLKLHSEKIIIASMGNLIENGKPNFHNLFIATQVSKPIDLDGESYNNSITLYSLKEWFKEQSDITSEYKDFFNMKLCDYGETTSVPTLDSNGDVVMADYSKPLVKYTEVMMPKPVMLFGLDWARTPASGVDVRIDDFVASLRRTTAWDSVDNPFNYPTSYNKMSVVPVKIKDSPIDNGGITQPGSSTNHLMSKNMWTDTAASKFMGDLAAGELEQQSPANENSLTNEDDGIEINMFYKVFSANVISGETTGILNKTKLPKSYWVVERKKVIMKFGGDELNIEVGAETDGYQKMQAFGTDTLHTQTDDLVMLKVGSELIDTGATSTSLIDKFIKQGVPRFGDGLEDQAPSPSEWQFQMRATDDVIPQPDAYSFFNYGVLTPVAVSTNYNLRVGNMVKFKNEDGSTTSTSDYWKKTVLVSDLTDNNFNNPDKTYTYLSFVWDDPKALSRLEMMLLGQSQVILANYDENGKFIDELVMNTSGKVYNNGTKWITELSI